MRNSGSINELGGKEMKKYVALVLIFCIMVFNSILSYAASDSSLAYNEMGYSGEVKSFQTNVQEQLNDFKITATFDKEKLIPNQFITANVTVENISVTPFEKPKDVIVIVGLHNEVNALVNAPYLTKSIPYKGTETIKAGFKLPSKVDGYSIRIFVWDGTSLQDTNMTPLAEVIEFPAKKTLKFTSISLGERHIAGLRDDGTVAVWGYNEYGQCNTPSGLTDIKAVCAGHWHTAALKSDGTVVAWGGNGSGQCNVPAGLTEVTAIEAGLSFTIALKKDGSVVGWGKITVPDGLKDVKQISSGPDHVVALKKDGTVVTFGDSKGEVPDGLHNVKAVSAGFYHSVALKEDGTVVA